MLVEEESCPVYDTNNEAEESMSVYDTDIEDVIKEEEGFSNNPHQVSYNIPKALPVDVGCITTASIVSTPVNSGNLSLPVIYHVLKREPKPFSRLIVPETNSLCSPVGEGSSASLGFSDSQENSSLNSNKDCHEIEELSASEEYQGHHDTSDYDNRTHAVSFRDLSLVLRFTMKESCIVCDAKYCSKCLLRVIREMSEVLLVQTCAYPPKTLVLGSYWYDNMSGLWGKEGHKPSRVISLRRSIRGSIKEDILQHKLKHVSLDVLRWQKDREDQENIVNELVCHEKDRVEAWKVFKKITNVLAQAVCLEEKAKQMLSCEVQMSEFEDVIRMSEDLSAVIPTLDAVKGALFVATSWLTKSKSFLASDFGLMSVLNSFLRVDTLKNLVSESKSLKILVGEKSLLEEKDEGFQATFARWNEFSTLPMVAEYFLSRTVEILSMTYEPYDEDILYADGIMFSNRLASMEYSVPSTLQVTFMDATE
nr:ARID DNA-binding domain-containing protein [Tanacetum cinerariifolium]